MTFNYQVGGSLPADAPSYVERQCDRDYYDLLKERKYCYVFNCRQMGKSSLRVRVTHKLQAEGVVRATIDPQKIGVEVTCEQWYASAIRSLVGDLDLKNKFDLRSWIRERELLSPVQRFAEFIETVVLQEVDAPIVIFVEEIDRLLSLKFGMDDFFGLVRSFFEDRPTKPEYNRLTFSFLGVATPTDLIQSHNTSAFNIGYAVEMAGFTLTEALPLMQGLASKVANPQDYLEEAVKWTGGQPFLIQRLLGMMEKELAGIALPENIAVWVENLVQERIVTNWESQDAPPHLTTIRDRVLSVEEKLRGRMLGCYQQVLADGELADDRSEERSKLRLTGLVVRRDGRLISYNPIYGAVFNNSWVEGQLADLRPDFYGSAFRAWQDADLKDSFLLRGEALQNADEWSRGKRLSDADEEFLRESREIEKVESNLKLEAERQARETAEQERLIALKQQEIAEEEARILEERAIILDDAKQKADRRVKVGSAILAVTLALAGGAGVWATRSVNEADTSKRIANDIKVKAESDKQKAEKELSDALIQKQNAETKTDSATSALKNTLTETAKAKEEKEKADAEVAKAKDELGKLAEESEMRLASANTELRQAEASTERSEAARQVALNKIALADVTLTTVNAKIAFLDNDGIKFMLLAVDASKKLKQIVNQSQEWQELQQDVLLILQQATYRVPEQNRLKGHTGGVRSANFSADGSKIVTASDDKTARVWDIKGNLIAELKGHIDVVKSANFSADGSEIVTASLDNTARVWEIENDSDLLLIGLCKKLQDYLSTNPNASDEDRQMCGIAPRQK